MESVIDKIIDECLKNKELNKCKEDVTFYEDCRKENKEAEKNGADYSQCKNFHDLCEVHNNFIMKEILNIK